MDAKAYTAGIKELRGVRNDLVAVTKELAALQRHADQLAAVRDKLIVDLSGYGKAKDDRIATAAGLSISEVTAIAPSLAVTSSGPAASPGDEPSQPPAVAATAPGALAPDLRPRPDEGAEVGADRRDVPASADSIATGDASTPTATPSPPSAAAAPAPPTPAAVPGAAAGEDRALPSIPAGERGQAWAAVDPKLKSTRPQFTQQSWDTAFLDAATGSLVYKDRSGRIDLGSRSAADILTAVAHVLPESVQRVYITAGDPWHRDTDSHPSLKAAVASWLNAPVPGWTVASGKGQAASKDLLAGHFVHERHPVGRWQRDSRHLELVSIGTWFDPEGAHPTVVRDAFLLLWKELREHWKNANEVVLMGSPARTGRDLWTRTIPTKANAKWNDGYPVMSTELRELLHATAGQGRTELITPPNVPDELPQLTEMDRTFAYAKHTWISAVGVPQRVTAQTFASWSEAEQIKALYRPSHWQVRVTVPDGWNHVGLLPAPITGEAAWHYPNQGGRTFTTWAGGAEINLALRNHLQPWKIEILDGLVWWEDGAPLRIWAGRLKDAWAALQKRAEDIQNDDDTRAASHLASRAVRSILLYGIGGFAQRPRTNTGSVPVEQEGRVPRGAEIINNDGKNITWQRVTFSPDPNAHPEWSAGVWSGARAALLSTRMREDDVSVGALHLPPGSIIAFRTDALYTTAPVDWPYHGQPGDYLMKGHLNFPVTAPTSLEDLMSLRDQGRANLEDLHAGRQ
ncbi:hypothetical protein O3X23_12980 [Streptomyces sp. H39-S7]|nr:hypothetical protein [Streptomyces sp. H39-S7]MCZ4120285.1 hypothetical protein [Streptomyces sp. H39-S7]